MPGWRLLLPTISISAEVQRSAGEFLLRADYVEPEFQAEELEKTKVGAARADKGDKERTRLKPMRVDERSLSDPVSSTASRSAESQRIQVDSGGAHGQAGTAGGDRVDLSGLAGRLTQAMQALANKGTQRVNQLQQDFRAGRYQPDAVQIGRALAAEWTARP